MWAVMVQVAGLPSRASPVEKRLDPHAFLDVAGMDKLNAARRPVDSEQLQSLCSALHAKVTALGLMDLSREGRCAPPRRHETQREAALAAVKLAACDKFSLPFFEMDRHAMSAWDGTCPDLLTQCPPSPLPSDLGTHSISLMDPSNAACATGTCGAVGSTVEDQVNRLEEHGFLRVHDWGLDLEALQSEAKAALQATSPSFRSEPRAINSSTALPSLRPLLANRSLAGLIRRYLGGSADASVRYDGMSVRRLHGPQSPHSRLRAVPSLSFSEPGPMHCMLLLYRYFTSRTD